MTEARRGMAVHASDGKAGRVDDVLLDGETGQPAFLVIDAAGFFSSDVVVPFTSVQNVDEGGVWLALTRDEVKHSPAYDAAHYGASAGLVSAVAAQFKED